MCRQNSGSMSSKTVRGQFFVLLAFSIRFALAKGNPSPHPQRSSGSNVGARASTTGTPTTTELPFGYLDPKLDYFDHTRDSSEEGPEVIRFVGRMAHNMTYQDN